MFLNSQGGRMNIILDFILQYAPIPTNISYIDISLLLEPYKEFSLFSSYVMWWELNSHVPRSYMYILYFSFKKDVILDQTKVISNEISF